MTREEIIKLARDQGATPYTNRHYPDRPTHTFNPEQLERFFQAAYAAGAAAEREACAKVCEERGQVKGGEVFAARIRARGHGCV